MSQAPDTAVHRLTSFIPDPNALRFLPEPVARECLAVPLRVENGSLVVATANPGNSRAIRQIAVAARRSIHPLAATYPDIRDALDLAYGGTLAAEGEPAEKEVCLRMGYIQPEELPLIQSKAEKSGLSFLDACESLGLIDEDSLTEARSILYHIPYLRKSTLFNLPDLSELVSWELADKYRIVPLFWVGDHLIIGATKPRSPAQIREIAARIGIPIQYVLVPRSTWHSLFRRFYLRGQISPDLDSSTAQALVRQNVLSAEDLQAAVSIHEQTGRALEDVILEHNLVSRRDWFRAKAKVCKMPFHDLEKSPPEEIPEPVRRRLSLPPQAAEALGFLPLMMIEECCVVGLTEPTFKRIRFLEQMMGCPVEARLIDKQQLQKFYTGSRAGEKAFGEACLPSLREYAVGLGAVASHLPEVENGKNVLLSSGLLDPISAAEQEALQTDLPFTQMERVQFSEEQLSEVPRDLIIKGKCIPLVSTTRELWLAVTEPLNGSVIRDVEKAAGKRVWPVVAPVDIVQSVIDRYVAPPAQAVHQQAARIVEQLVENALINQMQASRALQVYASGLKPLDAALAEVCLYKLEDLIEALAGILGLPAVSLLLQERSASFINPLGEKVSRTVVYDPVDESAARLIDVEMARKWCALPISETEDSVTVAFANPDFQPALASLQTVIDRKIQPVLAPRRHIEEAIERTLGRRNLGTYLLMAGLVTRAQLNRALDIAKRTGVRLGQALINQRFITSEQLYRFLAEQSGLPYLDLSAEAIDVVVSHRVPGEAARRYGFLPVREENGTVLVAITDPLDTQARALAEEFFNQPVKFAVVSDVDMNSALERVYQQEYLAKSVSELLERSPDDSAYHILTSGQKICLAVFLVISAIWLFFNHLSYLIILNVLSTLFYVGFSAYKLYLIYRALNKDLEVPVSQEEIDALDDADLPVYTILIPVYHEAKVLPKLLEAIDRFDYPSTKLDIKVLLEEDDHETIQAFYDWNPPAHFQGIIVPYAQPKTKPKACNYGLIHARGDIVVIYDAEDRPDPDQLKKAVVAFRKVDRDVVCIQSKLNYFNRDQNLLTSWFTIEYSMWFDLFLPGLVASGAPVPLGGTSNHFRRDALIECGAWDPYNVTEDADLGVRLYKRGYKTAVIDSTTLEEANSRVGNWLRQRSRWIKGYIVTWLVHMRHPHRLLREIGFKAFLGFQFVVAGTFFSALVNPIYWFMTTLWYLVKWQFIQDLFPALIFHLGAICLFFGNFAFTYINVAGVLRRQFYGMVKYALVSPFYWAMASLGAWRGFVQLFHNPFYWEKTVHGFQMPPDGTEDQEPENGNRKGSGNGNGTGPGS